MDGESDADEFFDATEFPSSSSPIKDDSETTTNPTFCQEDLSPTWPPKDPSTASIVVLDKKHCVKDQQDDLACDIVDGSTDKISKDDGQEQKPASNYGNKNRVESIDEDHKAAYVDFERGIISEREKRNGDANDIRNLQNKHNNDLSRTNLGSLQAQDNLNEKEMQNERTEQTVTPVAPPRRKKKNKKRPEPVQNLRLTGHEDFTSQNALKKQVTEQVKDSEVENELPKAIVDDNQDKDDVAAGDSVDSDLDISTQEMSEILDRNNYTEVISPQHMSAHLQRNKSQSISSIGSFCSVSSNISFQDKVKRSGSQVSLGSLNATTEKTIAAAPGDQLTDQEILEKVVVKNLDTGECIPLSLAEKHVPAGVNPLALQIMRLTSEYSSKRDLASSDREDAGDGVNETTRKITRKKKKLRGLFGRKVQKLKTTKDGGKRPDESSSSDEDGPQHADSYIKIKSANGKGIPIINKLNLIQDLSGQHQGAVWTMKFSCCGKLLGTAGQDKVVHVWVLKNEKNYFEQMRAKYAKADTERPASPDSEKGENEESIEKDKDGSSALNETDYPEGFCKEPFCSYRGHIGDVLDLSWSKNYFLLSSSMDKTVRLWHISRNECLCCFQHIDFVTAITFHPRDDRYFLSGSLDGKIRLWNIPDKKVALWNELEGAGSNLITAANFCMNGKFAVVGTYDGRCIFYETEHLKYFTQWQVRSTRKKQGRKISGIEPMPGEDKILITSNDSRIRLYSLKDHSLHCKYKGFTNSSSQIKGSFSHDGEFVISGSEDHYVYMWRAQHRIPSSRKDRNDFYESFSAHNAVVTAAIFAPCPWNVVPTEYDDNSTGRTGPEVIVAADWTGAIKIFINRYQNDKNNL